MRCAGTALIGSKALVSILGLGEAQITGAEYDGAIGAVRLLIEHPKMPQVQDGERPPDVMLSTAVDEYGRVTDWEVTRVP